VPIAEPSSSSTDDERQALSAPALPQRPPNTPVVRSRDGTHLWFSYYYFRFTS